MKKLNTLDASLLVMGSMIGSGIFLVSADLARNLGNPWWVLAAWVLTLVLTCMGAYAYGKLSSILPYSGGQYVYLKEAYSPMLGFLFGWSTFSVIQTGTIAAVAVAFAKYAGELFPIWINEQSIGLGSINTQQLTAAGLILSLTIINLRGVSFAALVQNFFTITKILSIVLLVLIGCYWGMGNDWSHLQGQWQGVKQWKDGQWHELGTLAALSVFGATMIGPLFSASSWNNLTFASQDFDHPQKSISKGMLYGAFLVCFLYLLTNLAYFGILPLEGDNHASLAIDRGLMHAKQDRIGSAALEVVFGPIGGIIMAIGILISTFGCNNGIILAGGRLFQAMAKDGLFFGIAKNENTKGAPAPALYIQGLWSMLLCFSGTYGDLLDFTVVAILLFYVLTVAILLQRKWFPQGQTLGMKLLLWTYFILMAGIGFNLLYAKPMAAGIGLLIVLSGWPIYYLFRKYQRS